MAEYIEREYLLEDIDASMKDSGIGYVIGQILKRYIKRQTPADVAPVRHGRWIKRGYACGDNEYECSVCHETEWRTSAIRLKYCPYCGARMDGGETDA